MAKTPEEQPVRNPFLKSPSVFRSFSLFSPLSLSSIARPHPEKTTRPPIFSFLLPIIWP